MSFDSRALRRQFPLLAGDARLHYLDNAATAQFHETVLERRVAHETRDRANVQRGSYPRAGRASFAPYNNDADIYALLEGLAAARKILP